MKDDRIFKTVMSGDDADLGKAFKTLGYPVDDAVLANFILIRQRFRRANMYFFIAMLVWLIFGVIVVVFRESLDKNVQLIMGLLVGPAVLYTMYQWRRGEKNIRNAIETIVSAHDA